VATAPAELTAHRKEGVKTQLQASVVDCGRSNPRTYRRIYILDQHIFPSEQHCVLGRGNTSS